METVRLEGKSGKVFDVGLINPEYEVQWTKKEVLAVPIYDHRFIPYIADWIKYRTAHGHDNIIVHTGVRRGGKTTEASEIAREVDADFPVSNVTFKLEDFNKCLATNPRADPKAGVFPQVLLDEAGFDLYAGNWMYAVSKNMVRKFEVIGEKQQTVHLVLPHRKKLIKGIREDMAQFWINVQTVGDEEMRGFAVLRKGIPNEWQEESYWMPQAAFTFEPLSGPWYEDYLVKKRAFVDEVAAEDPTEGLGSTRLAEITAQRNRAVRLLRTRTGMTLEALGKALGLSTTSVFRICGD